MSDPFRTSKTMSQIDAAVATRLMELSDESNYGTLDELQLALSGWAMDLSSGAISLADEVQGDSDEGSPQP